MNRLWKFLTKKIRIGRYTIYLLDVIIGWAVIGYIIFIGWLILGP